MNSIRNLIADDSFAISFQSMGQYRTALLKALDATPSAPEVIEAVGRCARIELVVALHALASQFENETAAFTGDDLEAVQGHVKHARKIAAKHNRNGPGCAPPAPEAGEVGELVAGLSEIAQILRTLQWHPRWVAKLARAATLLQQQESRVAFLRYVLIDCGQAVGGLVNQSCSDSFLLDVATVVRLAIAKPAPAGVSVAVSDWEDVFMGGVCVALATAKAHGDNVIWREIVRSVGVDNALNYAANVNPEDWDLAGFSEYAQLELGKGKPLPLPQAGEVQA
jgi:hypothetical protein